jgi:glyoxylate carboligase
VPKIDGSIADQSSPDFVGGDARHVDCGKQPAIEAWYLFVGHRSTGIDRRQHFSGIMVEPDRIPDTGRNHLGKDRIRQQFDIFCKQAKEQLHQVMRGAR